LEPAPDLRESVARSVEGMSWLRSSDDALVNLAKKYAEQIEAATDRAEMIGDLWSEARGDRSLVERLKRLEAMADVAKMVGWLGPQLQGVLRDLGGTPAARAAMKADRPIGGRLAELRAGSTAPTRRKRPAKAVDPTEGEGA